MLPGDLLRVTGGGPSVVPWFLTPPDWPWLRELLDIYERFEGRPRRELELRMREPLRAPCPPARLAQARHVLDRACRTEVKAPVPPRRIRRALFAAAAASPQLERAAVVARAATELGIAPEEVDGHLFADLGSERALGPVPEDTTPQSLQLEVNLALVSGILARAELVEIRLRGNARDVVRHARLRGLICTVEAAAANDGDVLLRVSGPLALFRRTVVYGRALASLVRRLSWCERWELTAECVLGDERRRVVVSSGAPLPPPDEPRRFDSKLEARFARDFARAAPDWELVREPRPVCAGSTLVFPDFELVHRRDPARRWLCEIVGFWTPDYLERKLARLRAAADGAGERWLLLVDAERACGPEDLPAGARLVTFRRRIDAAAVARLIDGAAAHAPAGRDPAECYPEEDPQCPKAPRT